MIKSIRILLIITCFISIASCDPEGCTPADHEISTKFDMGCSGPGGVHIDDKFNIEPCIISFKESLTRVTFRILLPPEVTLLNGDLYWKGDLAPKSQQCLYLRLHSKTDWRVWSAPINIHAEFLYLGEKITGDQNWSADETTRYKTIWQKDGKEIRND